MTNVEARMGNTSGFVIRASFVIHHWSFVIYV
jgi:hypothetical protein